VEGHEEEHEKVLKKWLAGRSTMRTDNTEAAAAFGAAVEVAPVFAAK
jgi:hypothetical protein